MVSARTFVDRDLQREIESTPLPYPSPPMEERE